MDKQTELRRAVSEAVDSERYIDALLIVLTSPEMPPTAAKLTIYKVYKKYPHLRNQPTSFLLTLTETKHLELLESMYFIGRNVPSFSKRFLSRLPREYQIQRYNSRFRYNKGNNANNNALFGAVQKGIKR